MAPVVKSLSKIESIEAKVCVTGQHRQMLDQVLNLFEIKPDFDLNVMKPGQNLALLTSNLLFGMQVIFEEWRPDWVIVHGDTTTTLSATLASYYEKIPVAHVEAGLRTGNIYSPWPEEINRRVASLIAELHFAPTEKAKQNLLKEGLPNSKVIVTGNTVIDALLSVSKKLEKDVCLKRTMDRVFDYIDKSKKLILVTGHRRESFGDGFINICKALNKISQRDDVEIIYPVHMNPNVQEPVQKILKGKKNIHLVDPLEYAPFVYLMNRSYLILTDSGGIQEEAPSLGKPVLVMRDTTERPEALDVGVIKLVGTNEDRIYNEVSLLLDNELEYMKMQTSSNPYGDGKAAQKIADILR